MKTVNPIQDIIKLTPQANGLLFHALKEGNAAYHVGVSFCIQARTDEQALRSAWDAIQRHQPALRSRYVWQNLQHPHQLILQNPRIPLEYVRLAQSELDAEHKDGVKAALRQCSENWIRDSRDREFALDSEVFRIACFHCPELDLFELTFSFHHILMDGWSSSILLNAWLSTLRGELLDSVSAKGYAAQMWAGLSATEQASSREFWEGVFAPYTAESGVDTQVLSQPIFQQSAGAEYPTSRRQTFVWDEAKVAAIENLCANAGVTPASFVYLTWSLLLSKLTYQNKLSFGCTFSGRHLALSSGAEAPALGLFINTLPLVLEIDATWTLNDALQAVFSQMQQLQAHEKTPPLMIREAANKNGEFYDSILVFDNYPISDDICDPSKGAALVSSYNAETTHYPVSLTVSGDTKWQLELMVKPTRGSAQQIVNILTQGFCSLADAMLQGEAELALRTLEWSIANEDQPALTSFSQGVTSSVLPCANAMLAKINDNLCLAPERSLIESHGVPVRNAELTQMIAHYQMQLKRHGFVAGDRVALCADKSAKAAAAMLAIIFIGGSYVYINPSDPVARQKTLLKLSGSHMMLSDRENCFADSVEDVYVISLSHSLKERLTDARPLIVERSAQQEFYFIFTSGTTGVPKGIPVRDESVANLLEWFCARFSLSEKDVVLGLTELNFDPSVEDLFGSLLSGGRLVYPTPDVLQDKNIFAQTMASKEISVVNFIPGAIGNLLQGAPYFPSMRHWIFGGEALPQKLRDHLLEQGYKVHNHYGPSEATVDCLTATQQRSAPVTIGHPISNVSAMAVDIFGKPVPCGVKGELWVAGVGITQGYENNPGETQKAFGSANGQRFYRTGDLVSFEPEHGFSYFGRIDDQAKINGVRIEPKEIEKAALEVETVADTCLLPITTTQKSWWLFAESSSTAESLQQEIREHLRNRLPASWMPDGILVLDKFPRTLVGKVNRQILTREAKASANSAVPCDSETVNDPVIAKIQAVWHKVLGKPISDIKINFFDAGGNSLKMINLQSELQSAFGLEINVATLFEYPSMQGFGGWLAQQQSIQSNQNPSKSNAGSRESKRKASNAGRNRLSSRRARKKEVTQYDT